MGVIRLITKLDVSDHGGRVHSLRIPKYPQWRRCSASHGSRTPCPKGRTSGAVRDSVIVPNVLNPPESRAKPVKDGCLGCWLANCKVQIAMRTKSNREARLPELRASLLAERARITSDRQSQLQVLVTPENTATEDQVPLLHEQFVAITTSSRDRQRLASIQSALERLERGEFGICESCEEEIPLKRLQAIPWASCCVPCQERMERTASVDEQGLLLTTTGHN